MELIEQKSKILTKAEIEQLYPLVNRSGDWQINVNSFELVEKIIELWFEKQGYGFFDNPYEVIDVTVTAENEIEFTYVPNGINPI